MDLKKFWEHNHKTNNDYWLSGTIDALTILNYHSIDSNITSKKILDLGIGMGHLTKYLYSKGNIIFSCDISENALNNVKNIANTYLTSDLKNIEPVDLAISNLCFQHCNDEEIERFIKEINLAQNGIFSFQFAYLRDNEEPSNTVKFNIKNNTHYFRPLNTILNIINESNKKLLSISEPIHFYGEENFSWYIIKITNK